MYSICEQCGKVIVLINYDKARGVVGLTQAWVHKSRWARHAPVVPEEDK